MQRHVLKITTDDQQGLIYKICEIIFKNNLNIEQNSEFVESDTNKFFFRAEISGDFDDSKLIRLLNEALPPNSKIECQKKQSKDIIILATKESHCIGDLLIKFDSGELNANIKSVIANHSDLQNLVERFGVPFHFIDSENITRKEHELKVLECMQNYKFDYAVLAKYMRILSPDFVSRYPHKIINIHHSFLPAFIGANPYKQAYQRGVKIIGATSHFVTNDLDEGPIITQDVVRVDHQMSWQDMRKAGKYCEKTVLSKALDLVFDDRVFISGNKVIIL